MNKQKCESCRFSCKNFLDHCDFYLLERRQIKREDSKTLVHFWSNICASMSQ